MGQLENHQAPRYILRGKLAATPLPDSFHLNDSFSQMSLATPLIYTRGTPIHIHMQFTSTGRATSDPSTIRIALVRTVRVTSDGSTRLQKRGGSPSGMATRACIASAACYCLPQDETVVHGEIKVPKDLTPEFEF